MKEKIWKQISEVRTKSPLVHNITNYVVMNNTANALLAAGASPVMAHAQAEVQDMVNIAGALIVNIGTLDEYWVESMELAAGRAKEQAKPWVLDPVGAGATPFRNQVLQSLLKLQPSVIRGNASEIMAITNVPGGTKGVDSIHESVDAVSSAKHLNQQTGSVVCVSGAADIIIHESRVVKLSNGDPLMSKVTGLGCTASALIGAFVAVNPADPFLATVSAMAFLGVAGELAARKSAGPGSLQLNLLDVLYSLPQEEFMSVIRIEEKNEE
ncbi:hydroxyethylthiazole kinase [Arcticibacter tournemirensis]|uniref:Hydroxyethylthiazole kinase n=1 Tax=Arcticibacter tournemirensis TaxID=699437 RepID=A0A5M9HAU5_9SPHI|nr:hydroxyethylthiazole kinase [Arcticibacter tournemirensis]KAA8483375.1 hydroxyethylthiazole kinase [Arcticibacter tournemirensis]TQM50934.1 hydroxyethylthiazole kinase [Arcticibacter tournemirensis]